MTHESKSPWELYNKMIEGIPEGIGVTDFCTGSHWVYIDAECGMGIAHAVAGGSHATFKQDLRELDLKGVASLVKSWHFPEAALGTAALNAWYASPEKIEAAGGTIAWENAAGGSAGNPYATMEDDYRGKNVVMVGHFPNAKRLLETCNLTVLERACRDALDTPDTACEYVVPECDFLFMTGITITNKTAPRLLDLARNATTVMTGPSAVACDALFEAGLNVAGGSVVVDRESAKFAIKGGSKMQWRTGIKKFELRR